MRSLTIGFVLALCLASVVVAASDEADAAPAYSESYYIYSYDLDLVYTGGTTDIDSVVWTVQGYNGDALVDTREYRPTAEPWSATVDRALLEGSESVYVTQTVSKGGASESETYRFVPIADVDDDDPIVVTFYDGYTGESTGIPGLIYSSTAVAEGGDFVTAPAAPSREGHDFLGWFYGDDLSKRFDPKAPVTGDTDVYARWVPVGSSSGGSGGAGGDAGVQVGPHSVTFVTDAGIGYTVLSVSGSALTFAVTVDEGIAVSTLDVAATGGTVQVQEDGTYVLSGVGSDIVVTITGDAVFGTPEEPGSGSVLGSLWWVLPLIVVIAIVAFLVLRGRS